MHLSTSKHFLGKEIEHPSGVLRQEEHPIHERRIRLGAAPSRDLRPPPGVSKTRDHLRQRPSPAWGIQVASAATRRPRPGIQNRGLCQAKRSLRGKNIQKAGLCQAKPVFRGRNIQKRGLCQGELFRLRSRGRRPVRKQFIVFCANKPLTRENASDFRV